MNRPLNQVTRQRHAFECHRDNIFNLLNKGDTRGFTLHNDEPECWDPTEIEEDYLQVVNVELQGESYGDLKRKGTKHGIICMYEVTLDINLTIYTLSCDSKAAAMRTEAHLIKQLFDDGDSRIPEHITMHINGSAFDRSDEFDSQRTKRIINLAPVVYYAPSRPSNIYPTK